MKARKLALLAGAAVPLLGFGAGAAQATDYSLSSTITLPADQSNTSGSLSSFDISYYDPTTNLYVLGDRSNNGIDIINGTTMSYVGRAGGFVGFTGNSNTSGPDGVLIAHTPTGTVLFGGDGNSTLHSYNISNPSNPVQNYSPVSTGGSTRLDEMAYSPSANLLLAANNAATPAFGTLFNASTGAIVKGNITIPGAAPSDGLEQSVWDPKTNSFYISLPAINGDAGGVAQINTDGSVGMIYDFNRLSHGAISSCSSTGLAVGSSGDLLVGCSNTKSQTVLLDPTARGGKGKIVATNTAISGTDEVYFNPTLNDFYVTGVNSNGSRVFDVLADDPSLNTVQSVALPDVSAHSIAVDPNNNDVYVPLEASPSNKVCTSGCVAVFAEVPEPGTLPVLFSALSGLALLGFVRQRRRPIA